MDRRKALKTIGIGTGAITLTPAVVGIFQSCKKNIGQFTPIHFSNDDFSILSKLMDLILPKTDIPGAIELKLPEFLDGYIDVILSDPAKQEISIGLDQFLKVALNDSGKNKSSQLDLKDLDNQLAKYLKAGEGKQKELDKKAKQFFNKKKTNSKVEIPNIALASSFAIKLRSLTITAFKTNEYIGENVLAYAPIPGEQIGCIDLNEATGGKAWSL
tara:strand:- start:5496 stop:6140 length:645 start_codon:yes stop_codon:yes gene_type:complete